MAGQAQDLVTLQEAKEFLVIKGSADDARLELAVTAASDIIERLTARKLKARSYTNLRFVGPRSTKLYVPAWPIDTAQAVTIRLDEIAQTVWRVEADGDIASKDVMVASDDPWDDRHGRNNHFVRTLGWQSALGFAWGSDESTPAAEDHRVLLSYSGGYNPVPRDLQLACLYLVQKLWREEHKQLGGIASVSSPGGNVAFANGALEVDHLVPRETWQIVTLYRRPAAFAVA